MKIMKFGGTSVGSASALEGLCVIVKKSQETRNVVIVSAFNGVTDALVNLAKTAVRGGACDEALAAIEARHVEMAEAFLKGGVLKSVLAVISDEIAGLKAVLGSAAVLKELSARTLDRVMSFGELLSSFIIAGVLREAGLGAVFIDSRDVIKTDASFGKAKFLQDISYANIREACKDGALYVAPGFIASTVNGDVTTLGRGGSDLSAAIFAAALDADALELWTDVNGVLTCDPKIVSGAFTIKEMPYIEAMEMSHFGAKVLHPPTIQPVLEKKIPIKILNSFNPDGPFTLISHNAKEAEGLIRGISCINSVSVIKIEGAALYGRAGFASRLFVALGRRNVNIILITQASSEYSICFAINPVDEDAALSAVREEFATELREGSMEPPEAEGGLSVIAVVGSRMKSSSGIAGKVFHALGRSGVNVVAIAQGSSEINISAVIPQKDKARAMNAVHEAFFLSGVRSVNLFLAGVGLIGGELLKQIAAQREQLEQKYKIRIRVTGLANSRNMTFNEEGVQLNKAKEILASGEPCDLKLFVQKMKERNLPNSAFCDCTASADVALMYEEILHALIPVITPNKKANSGSFEYYNAITSFSRDRGVPYLYEVTVCAGLPVISTLRDLYLSGDKVTRIEAVLSGTLSFIFNSFDGSIPFSALVCAAKEKGYTEPDPRDDLNAMDAARKALILARECGMPLEFSQVEIDPILPDECFQARTVDDFFAELEKSDAQFEAKRLAAQKEGGALRYIAVIEEGKARISLRTENVRSPFCSLTGADNIVVIHTNRYNTLPLVIKGPGAGAEVTAGGVFADIVRIARTLV
ncbi:MAG: bifunctional aspartate kinase/homoserine dehydrogenase I [Spirochaetaceae bacterium]|jgi:aspartokinase/homoserine dehydrogenase 1|nr:bifunctional aspartate kinase/homoserine dehydrogenase I [Spirochaetaceae bacterium]